MRDVALPLIGGPSVSSIVNDALDAFAKLFGKLISHNLSNTMKSAITTLAGEQSADMSVTWFRDILGTVLAVVFLMTFLSVLMHGIRAVFGTNLEPFVASLVHMLRVLIFAPYIPAIIAVLIYVSDVASKASVQLATINLGKKSDWQVALSTFSPTSAVANKIVGMVGGVFLRMEISPLALLVYLYAILLTLTLGIGLVHGTDGLLFRWAFSGLVASIFAKPLMLFVMAISGNIIAHVSSGGADTLTFNSWVMTITALIPIALFFATAHWVKGAQRARKAQRVEAEVTNEINVKHDQQRYVETLTPGQRGRRAAVQHAADQGISAATPAAAEAVATAIGTPVAGVVTAIGIEAGHRYWKTRRADY